MRHNTTFSGIALPYVSGVELGVSITSPSGANEDVACWLEEAIVAIRQLDALVFVQIQDPAREAGHVAIADAADRVLSLTSGIARQLAVSAGVLDAITRFLPEDPEESETAPALRRAVAELRSQEAWRQAVATWQAGEAAPIPAADTDADAHFDAVGETFAVMIDTPAPTVEAVIEKVQYAHKSGYTTTEAFMSALLRDLRALTLGGGNSASSGPFTSNQGA